MIQNAKIVSIGADHEDYFKQKVERGAASYVMSSSALKLFSGCPRRWLRGYNLPESKAKDFGSLLDCLLTTPQQFDKRYVMKPAEYENSKGKMSKWTRKSTTCAEWEDEKEAQGLHPVAEGDITKAKAATERLREDEVIAAYLDASDRQVHLTAEWHDKATGLVVPVQGLVDLVPRTDTEFADTIGDLKTTRNAGLIAWQRWAFSAGYHIQAGLYIDLYNQATAEQRNTFCYVLLENFEPWEPAKRLLQQDFMQLGQMEYKRLLANYCACLKHNRWPSYDDTDEAVQGWGMCSLEPFQAERAMFAPHYDFEETETTTEPDTNEAPIP